MHRTGRARTARALPAVLAVALVAACGGGGEGSGEEGAPASITVALELPVANMDGLVSNSAAVNQMIGAALTRVGVDGGLEADLATAWTPNADASEWTFTLRPDVRFSDGSPLTADDVVFSYETVLADPSSQQNVYVAPVTRIVAEGEDTVVMTLEAPNATWPRIATNLPIAPRAVYDPETATSAPVTAGEYEVVEFNGTDTVQLAANPDYYGEQPEFTEVTVTSVPDETTRLNGLQSGQFDVAMLAGNNVTVAESAGLEVARTTGSKVVYLGYDSGEGPMADELLRRAVTYAVDRQALVETVLAGYGEATDQMVSATTFGHDAAAEVPAQDLAEARRLVEQSGYDGEPIPLRYPAGYIPAPDDLAQAVASYLDAVGITVELQPTDAAAFLQSWLAADLGPLWLFSAQTSTLEGAGTFKFVDVTLRTAEDPVPAEQYDAMVAEGDEDARLELMAEMNRYRTEKAYYTPLFSQDYVYVMGEGVALPTPPANGFPNPALFTRG